MLSWVKGTKALGDSNFDTVEKYYSDLAKNLDPNDPNLTEVLKWVYPPLLISYKRLDRREDFEKAKAKAIQLFPEKKEAFEKIWPLSISK